jgi:short-subunit dehydrogenase
MQISGSKALVTGASSGIGAATAKALAARGATVALLARTASALENVAEEIRAAGGRAQVFPLNAADWRAVEALAPRLFAEFGLPEIVVNCAGAGRWLFTEETPPEEAITMMGAPYFAAFFITRACLPHLLAQRRGHIVNINSPVARLIWPGAAGYAAARGALQTYTDALRADLYGTGVRTTSIVTGKVDTPYFDHNPGVLDRAPRAARLIPTVTAGQVAGAIVRAVEYNQREVVLPFMLRVFFLAHMLIPWFTEWLAISTGHRHSRG